MFFAIYVLGIVWALVREDSAAGRRDDLPFLDDTLSAVALLAIPVAALSGLAWVAAIAWERRRRTS